MHIYLEEVREVWSDQIIRSQLRNPQNNIKQSHPFNHSAIT